MSAPPRINPPPAAEIRQALIALAAAVPDAFERLFVGGTTERLPSAARASTRLLRQAQLLARRGLGALRATVALPHVGSNFIATDRRDRSTSDQVLPLLLEQAYAIERLDVRPGTTVFEPCVGSGAIALAAAAAGANVLGSDISPRALEFFAFNAALCGLNARVEARRGSLFEVLHADERFDRIVVNPPFEPVPHDHALPLHSAAGPDGLDLVRKILPEVAGRRRPSGTFHIVTWTPTRGDVLGELGPLLERHLPADRIEVVLVARGSFAEHAARFGDGRAAVQWRESQAAAGLHALHLVHAIAAPSTTPGIVLVEDPAGLARAADQARRWGAPA